MHAPVRIVDVAKAAGVSKATVSNVLRRPDLVSRCTREKVQVAIRALNYEIDEQVPPQTDDTAQLGRANANDVKANVRKRPESRAVRGSHINPYFTPAQAAQVRAALQAAGLDEGYVSLSDLVVAATMAEVKRLQWKYNGGRAWRGVAAGKIRQGRPTRGELMRREERLRESG